MGTTRSMARNLVAMMGSQVITWAATFVLVVHLPRALGAEGYGKLNFVTAFVGMFAILVDFGTSRLVTREVARDRSQASAYLTNVTLLKLVTALVAYAGLMVATMLMGRPADVIYLTCIMGIGMVMGAVGSVLDSMLQGFERVHLQAWGDVIDKVLKTIVVLSLLLHGAALPAIVWGMVGVGIVPLVRKTYWVLQLVKPDRRVISAGFVRRVVRQSMPFLLFAVFARVYDTVDVMMLAVMTSDAVVGWYAAAYRLFSSLFFLPHILYTVAFPVLSRFSSGDAGRYRVAVQRCFGVLAAAAVGMSVCTVLLAGPVVEILYSHEEFPGTAGALRILGLALGIQYINTVIVLVLQTQDLQARWAKAGAMAALFNPAINYLLIPPLQHLGAATTTVLTELLLLVVALRSCPPGIFDRWHARVFGRALLAGAPLAAALALGLRWGLGPAVCLGLPIYALAILRLGVISQADVALVRNAIRLRVKGA